MLDISVRFEEIKIEKMVINGNVEHQTNAAHYFRLK
jgi:hypothetical protein